MTTVVSCLSLSAALLSYVGFISISDLFSEHALDVRVPVVCCVWGQTVNNQVNTRNIREFTGFRLLFVNLSLKITQLNRQVYMVIEI